MNTKQIAEEAAERAAKSIVAWQDSHPEIIFSELGVKHLVEPYVQAAIEKAVRACTCIPDDEHDCPVHVPNRGQQQPKAEPIGVPSRLTQDAYNAAIGVK